MFIYIAVGWGRVFEIVSLRQLLLVEPARTKILVWMQYLSKFIHIAIGEGRVFEIVSLRQLLLVEPAPTGLLTLVHF
jgi:hypothetical protein